MEATALFGLNDHSKLDAWLRIVREHGGFLLPRKTVKMAQGRSIHHHRYVRVVAHIPPEHAYSFEICVVCSGAYDPSLNKMSDLHVVPEKAGKLLHPMWQESNEET